MLICYFCKKIMASYILENRTFFFAFVNDRNWSGAEVGGVLILLVFTDKFW